MRIPWRLRFTLCQIVGHKPGGMPEKRPAHGQVVVFCERCRVSIEVDPIYVRSYYNRPDTSSGKGVCRVMVELPDGTVHRTGMTWDGPRTGDTKSAERAAELAAILKSAGAL